MEKLEALENSTDMICVRGKKIMKEEPKTDLEFDTECKMMQNEGKSEPYRKK